MNISLLLTTLEFGGAERVMIQLANHLARKHNVEIVVRNNCGPLLKDIAEDVSVISNPGIAPWPIGLLLHLRRQKPDVIISTFWDLSCLVLLARKWLFPGSKIIVRDSVSPQAYIRQTRWGAYGHAFYRYAYPQSDAIVALSGSLAREVETLCRMKLPQLRVIENPLPPSPTSESLLPTEGITLLSIGRLNKQKGFDNLIRAVANLLDDAPNLKLKIVGTGPEREPLLHLANRLNASSHIDIIEPGANIGVLLASTHLYVLSSHYEGVSNAMLEAISAGVPVVATTRHTSASDYIINGENGVQVTTSTVPELAGGIRRALSLFVAVDWRVSPPMPKPTEHLTQFDLLLDTVKSDSH